jgi:hypothetical protein
MNISRVLMNASKWKNRRIPFKQMPPADKFATGIMYGGLTLYTCSVGYLVYSSVRLTDESRDFFKSP